jgi:selenide,water dikinase
VVLALNIAAFPERLPAEAIAAIFGAAASTVEGAGGVVAGGHTIRSEEPIFGLAVQGFVHPDRVLTKGAARAGDVLMLSKPIGSGIVLAGGTQAHKAAAIEGMRRLNRAASEALVALGPRVHAVTDVTGFGLLGHGWEIAERSQVRVALQADALPLYEGAYELAASGVRTGGDVRNREYLSDHVELAVSAPLEALAFDPQTSGGLLASVEASIAAGLVEAGFCPIGRIEAGQPGVVLR